MISWNDCMPRWRHSAGLSECQLSAPAVIIAAKLSAAEWGFRGQRGKSKDCWAERDKALKQRGKRARWMMPMLRGSHVVGSDYEFCCFLSVRESG